MTERDSSQKWPEKDCPHSEGVTSFEAEGETVFMCEGCTEAWIKGEAVEVSP